MWNNALIGEQHWAGYKSLDYEHVPTILTTYDPISLFHMSGLWALWVTWCSFFYEERSDDEKEDYTSNWVRLLMAEMKKQFIKRVCEAPAMTQWIKIVEDRTTSMEDQSNRIPEKEFLLVHSHLMTPSIDKQESNRITQPLRCLDMQRLPPLYKHYYIP